MLNLECPLSFASKDIITLAHGGGGQLTQQLLERIFRPAFNNIWLAQEHDGAHIQLPQHNIAVTTDSYVVDPLFFPGGNIGKLAMVGTLNDLAMCGSRPLYLTCGFILTEGLLLSTLQDIVESMRTIAIEHNVAIVAGDIKVVEHSGTPGIYINTTGIGAKLPGTHCMPNAIQENDVIILSGDIGRHGLAILGARNQFAFAPPIISDCASLWPQVNALHKNHVLPHCMRDLTRGGLAGSLIELAHTSHLSFSIEEAAIPVSNEVHAASEILGLDPLYVANEGRMLLFVPPEDVDQCLSILQTFPDGQLACVIGNVQAKTAFLGEVTMKTAYGSKRQLYLFSGEQLPRIC